MKARHKGFTLIELLLVAVLLLVVAGLSIPDLSKTYQAVQLRAASRNIAHLMRYAQSLAVIHQKEYRIYFTSSPARYWLEEETVSAGSEETGDTGTEKEFRKITGEKGRIFSLSPGIKLETSRDHIAFYPDATMDKSEVSLRNSGPQEIIISTQQRRGQIDVFSAAD